MRDPTTRTPLAFPVILPMVLTLLCLSSARPQGPTGGARDSLRHADTVEVIRMPLYPGSVERNLDSLTAIDAAQINWIDKRYLGDILLTRPAAFIRDQGSPGQYNELNVRGVDWRSVAVLMNGRTMNDPASGILNLFYVAPEYIDRLEFIPGPRAFLYGFGSSGGTVNIVPKYYWSARPVTKIDYSRGAYSEYLVDGTFAQNALRNLNFMFGFQYQGTDGRFTNTSSGAWNARMQFRYAPWSDVTLILSEYFTSTNTNMSGGIDIASPLTLDPFNPYLAAVRNADSYEKVTRHDVDLSLVGAFVGDSTDATHLSVYYSHDVRQYRDEENRQQPNGILIRSNHISGWEGMNLLQQISWNFQTLSFGGMLEHREILESPNLGRRNNTVGALWAKEEVRLGEVLSLAGYGRYESFLGRQNLGYGGDVRVSISRVFALYAGASRSRRPPNYPELYWSDSTLMHPPELRTETHTDLELGATLSLDRENSLSLSYFQRKVTDPIVYTLARALPSGTQGYEVGNGPASTGYGLELKMDFRVWVLQLEGAGTWLRFAEEAVRQQELYPELSGYAGLYYRNVLLGGAADLKAGLKGRFNTASRGVIFNGEALSYLPNSGPVIDRGAAVDFCVIAHVGDAYVHFIWENLTDAKYFATPYYPVRDRNIRFGISWRFLD